MGLGYDWQEPKRKNEFKEVIDRRNNRNKIIFAVFSGIIIGYLLKLVLDLIIAIKWGLI